MALVANGLCCGYGAASVIRDVGFSFEPGQTLCVLGPNGVGKTTLFKTLLGFLPPLGGTVELDGTPLTSLGRAEVARSVAYVSQSQNVPFSYSVEEFVLMGRAPHLKLLQQPGPEDRAISRAAMEQMGIGHLAKRACTEVSGGEMQMASIARALAQEPRYLVMDEPTASLDFGNQARVLERVLELASSGIGIIMTTHDPSQTFALGSQVVLLQRGGTCLCGPCGDILTEETLAATYGVEVWRDQLVRANRTVETCVIPVGH